MLNQFYRYWIITILSAPRFMLVRIGLYPCYRPGTEVTTRFRDINLIFKHGKIILHISRHTFTPTVIPCMARWRIPLSFHSSAFILLYSKLKDYIDFENLRLEYPSFYARFRQGQSGV